MPILLIYSFISNKFIIPILVWTPEVALDAMLITYVTIAPITISGNIAYFDLHIATCHIATCHRKNSPYAIMHSPSQLHFT